MKRVVTYLLLGSFVAGPCLAAGFLEKLAEAQKQATALAAGAHHPSGAGDLRWSRHEVTKKGAVIDVSAYEKPYLLAMSTDPAYSDVRGRILPPGSKDSDRLTWYKSSNYAMAAISDRYREGGKVEIVPNQTHTIWIGDEKTLQEIWKRYLSVAQKPYTDQWAKLQDQANLTPGERFHEVRAVRGRPFPTTPAAAARLYAKACNKALYGEANDLAAKTKSWADAESVRKMYYRSCVLQDLKANVERINADNLKLALEDMTAKFPESGLLAKCGDKSKQLAARKTSVLQALEAGVDGAETSAKALLADCREMMLANPLLDALELVAVRRRIGTLNLRDHEFRFRHPGRPDMAWRGTGAALGIPSLSTHNILKSLERGANDWNCDIVKLSNLRGRVKTTSLYTAPEETLLIGNARVHWDGRRVAFNMGAHDRPVALYELDTTTGKTKLLSPAGSKDHFIDTCYLPDGNIVVMATAIMTALPCEGGSHMMSNMYLLNPETGDIRQLGVDQENSYHATVQEDGRVMYIRYEYADLPHYYTRIVMNMNPDGTNQREKYGSNSVWPTSLFYPQQVPGEPDLFTAVVSGHHGPSHMGRLVLFDVKRGRREADGAVQFIGDRKKPLEAVMVDALYGGDYPKYMYSVPLDAAYHITLMKPAQFEPWGLYLVDRFDNKTLIHGPEEDIIAWPQIFRKTTTPPVIPSRVRPQSKTSTIYVQDIYQGPGLDGIPRGSVKSLAVFALHYGYKSAASHAYVGIESSWDARYLLGTVPVNEDGSVMFNVQSMLPIALAPLDKDGAALQRMRTWINPQPGEFLSCIGCHETVDHAPLNKPTMALQAAPKEIDPWYGNPRPYSYLMEVQPVLDKHCVSCHNGEKQPDGEALPDLRNSFSITDMLESKRYSASYTTLQKYVRRPGPESDVQLPLAMEWHASSSKLIQMLKKGHHGVGLDDEAWRRLYMWIDLNVPFHAAFRPAPYEGYGDQVQWRIDSLKRYASLDWNPEGEYAALVKASTGTEPARPRKPAKPKPAAQAPKLEGWPFAVTAAKERQIKAGGGKPIVLEFGAAGRAFRTYDRGRAIVKTLDTSERLEFVRIPAGRFVMGSSGTYPNVKPRIVEIKKPFWMSTTEISNSQLQCFDATHDSRYADLPGKDQNHRGISLHTETQPAVRVSHAQAIAFCEWLGKQTGKKITLPSEEQWEWAARAGTDSATWFAREKDTFGSFANLSDVAHGKEFRIRKNREHFLYDETVNDRHGATAPVKSYKANPWGLYDMIGNAEEWTSTPCPRRDNAYVVKGSSWFDVPEDATSAGRWAYNENIRLPDLGFRVIVEE